MSYNNKEYWQNRWKNNKRDMKIICPLNNSNQKH